MAGPAPPPCRLQGSFLLFWLVYWVSMCVAIALTLLAGAISPSVDVAGAVLPAYATTLLFFAGFMIPWGQLPDYWRWYATIGGRAGVRHAGPGALAWAAGATGHDG